MQIFVSNVVIMRVTKCISAFYFKQFCFSKYIYIFHICDVGIYSIHLSTTKSFVYITDFMIFNESKTFWC